MVNPNVSIDGDGVIIATERKVQWPETFSACRPQVLQGAMVSAVKRCMMMCTEVWSENRCILEHCMEWMRKGYKVKRI